MNQTSRQKAVGDFEEVWKALALERLRYLAATRKAFSTDEVWEVLDALPKPADSRLISVATRSAVALRLIAKTDLVVPSRRTVCHARPVQVWTSRLLAGTTQDALEYVLVHKRKIHAAEALELNLLPERDMENRSHDNAHARL